MTSTIDPRHLARLLALQVLYEADASQHSALDIVKNYANIALPSDDARASSYVVMQSFYVDRIEWDSDDNLVLDDQNLLPSPEVYPMLLHIVEGVTEHQSSLDEVIATYAPEYPLEQLAIVDRNILRIALHEIFFADHVPLKVAINEAVRLAKLYGADAASAFINGVLGVVADNIDDIRAQL